MILAIKAARQGQLTFSHLKHRDWAMSAKPLIYSLLAGVFLGLYLITWAGALLFVFIITVYFVIQFIIDHLKDRSTGYLGVVGVILFLVALMLFLPFSVGILYPASLVIALLIPPALNGISRLMAGKRIKRSYYPLAVVGLGLLGLAIIYLVSPTLPRTMVGLFSIFFPAGVQLTTIEMQPILFPRGEFSLSVVWGNFTTSLFLSLISLGILTYLAIKQNNPEKSLLIVWSLVILAATLGQRRFAYYLAVNAAVLTGYLSWQFLQLAGFRDRAAKPAEIHRKQGYYLEAPKKRDYYEVLGLTRNATNKEIKRAFRKLAFEHHPDHNHEAGAEDRFKELDEPYQVLSDPDKRAAYDRSQYGAAKMERGKAGLKERKQGVFHITTRQVTMALAVLVIFFMVFFPNIGKAKDTTSRAPFAPSDAWYSSLSWLKENTPEPFGDPDFYYNLYETPFHYPETAYGVMAWWDYGYWIARIAHRIPNANPGQESQAVTRVAGFFTSQDEKSASKIVQEMGTAYVIIDYETATSKFWAIALWAGQERTDFFDTYYVPQEGKVVPINLFYPEYYRSMSTRLYSFDGKAVTPDTLRVISFQENTTSGGEVIKQITSVQSFSSYEEATAYIVGQQSANYRIISDNPFISPVPLEALEHYNLVHGSDVPIRLADGRTLPAVKIFEYVGP